MYSSPFKKILSIETIDEISFYSKYLENLPGRGGKTTMSGTRS